MISKLISHPEEMNKSTLYELRELVAKYPYNHAARLLLLQNLYLLHDATFGEELRRAAFLVPDRRALFRLVEGKNYEITPAPERTVVQRVVDAGGDRTMGLIEQFLCGIDELPPSTPTAQAAEKKPAAAPRPLADPSSDYMAYLLQLDDQPVDDSATAVSSIPTCDDETLTLVKDEPLPEPESEEETPVPAAPVQTMFEVVYSEPASSETEPEENAEIPAEDGILTMTLAKIYIKQQRYDKALEIIKKVALENPKKNAYFADQIRFLQKLIINNRNKK